MFKHQLQREEQVFSRTQDSGETLLLLFRHDNGMQLEKYSRQGER